MTSELVLAAAKYTQRGWAVLPLYGVNEDGACSCGRADCDDTTGKHPRNTKWERNYLTDPEIASSIFARLEAESATNIGIVAGPSKLAVLDIDSRDAYAFLSEHLDVKTLFADAPMVKTSRGYHVYYADADQTLGPRSGRGPLKGIDVRAGNSFVVAPPSRHRTGHIYTWHRW